MLHNLLFNPELFDKYYNCSFYNVDKIPFESRHHYIIGIILLILFVFFESLYLPSIIVMCTKKFFNESCYKIMLYLGVVDVLCIFINAFLTGLWSIKGMVYCSSPMAIYFAGCGGLSLWIAQSDASIVLAINRCISMYDPNFAKTLFNGKKLYLWLFVPTAHSIGVFIFTKPVIFNGYYPSWLINPHSGYYDDFGVRYVNEFHTFTNASTPIILMLIYGIFLFFFKRKSKDIQGTNGGQNNETQKQIFLQVFTICGITSIAAALGCLPQIVRLPDSLVFLGSLIWTFAHGSPAIIYLTMNKSMRRNVKNLFCAMRTRIGTSSTTPQLHPTTSRG